jgi:hypothetical protein
MSKKKNSNLIDKFFVLNEWNDRFEFFFEELKILRKKRLIDRDTWSREVLSAKKALQRALNHAWDELHRRAAVPVFPQEYLREDQVMEHFHISQKTLYRRRRRREIAYIKDQEGIIWYPILDLVDYVRLNRSDSIQEKPGRPRKF